MSNVIDISQDKFLEEVIEKSKTIPVLVDFWAPWCGPCKQLTPILEKLINKKNGKIILAKINVDENQGIASQLNIQSIPTVYGFVAGRPIDAFQGVQPESKIEAMIDKMIDAAPGNEIPKLIEEANLLFKNQKFQEAQTAFENLIALDPGNIKGILGLIRCLIQLEKYEDANSIIDSLDDQHSNNEEIDKLKKLLDNLQNNDHSHLEELKAKIQEDPKNLELHFQLAEAYLANNQIENGFSELLEIFKINRQWNDEGAKKKLLEYFDLLGPTDPNVINARRKLSSLMFQ